MPVMSSYQRRIDELGDNTSLDSAVAPVRALVHRLLRNKRVKDALHGVWLGHPLHPALTDVPIGTWVSALVLDLTGAGRGAATVLVGTGVAAGVPTVAAGWTDWADLHPDQQRVGLVHAGGMAMALACYTASFVSRLSGRHGKGRLLGMLGFTSAMASATLGGHLAYRLSAGPNHAERVQYVAPEGWQDVCGIDELPEREPTRSNLGDVSVVLVRSGSQVFALSGNCAHLDGPLYEGKLSGFDRGEPCVTCPWHGSTYRLRDGAVVHGPSTFPQPKMDVRVEGGRVLLRVPSSVPSPTGASVSMVRS